MTSAAMASSPNSKNAANSPNRWVLGARVRTLPAAVVPVLLGTAVAWGQPTQLSIDAPWSGLSGARSPVPWERNQPVDWLNFCCALVVALALQVATNYANDYSDGKRGTDDPSQRVGPPRLVGNGLATAAEVKRAMMGAFAVALVSGGVLVLRVGWELIPIGLAAVAAGYFYTGGPKPYGYLGLGEMFVFVFFGLVATIGSAYVQTGEIGWLATVCGVAAGSLATAILVTNNLRDIPGDTVAGKRTLAVKLGDQKTRLLYVALLVVPILLLPIIAGLGARPLGTLAFLAVMVSTKPIQRVLEGASGLALIPVLQQTAKTQLVYGCLLSFGMVVSTYI